MDLDLQPYGTVRVALFKSAPESHPELVSANEHVELLVAYIEAHNVSLLSIDGHKGTIEEGDFTEQPSGSYIAAALIEKFGLTSAAFKPADKGSIISLTTLALDNSRAVISHLATEEELAARRGQSLEKSADALGDAEAPDAGSEEPQNLNDTSETQVS